MHAILVNYNFTPTWLLDSGLDYVIYDRSDDKTLLKEFDQSKIIYEENVGNVDFPKLSYLIENYDRLPDVFLWGKTNLFKYVDEARWNEVRDNKVFTPLLKYDHPTFSDKVGEVCYYKDGVYYERSSLLYMSDWQHHPSYPDFAYALEIPYEHFTPFAPGGNYILTKERVRRHPKSLYIKMRDLLPYTTNPVEAHWCERAYYTLWK